MKKRKGIFIPFERSDITNIVKELFNKEDITSHLYIKKSPFIEILAKRQLSLYGQSLYENLPLEGRNIRTDIRIDYRSGYVDGDYAGKLTRQIDNIFGMVEDTYIKKIRDRKHYSKKLREIRNSKKVKNI